MKKKDSNARRCNTDPMRELESVADEMTAIAARERTLPMLIDELIADLKSDEPERKAIGQAIRHLYSLHAALDRLPAESIGPAIRPFGYWLARVNSYGNLFRAGDVKEKIKAMNLPTPTDNKLIPLVQDFFEDLGGSGIRLPALHFIPAPYPEDAPLSAKDADRAGRITRKPSQPDEAKAVTVLINECAARKWVIPKLLKAVDMPSGKRVNIGARWSKKPPALSAETVSLYAEIITDFFWLQPGHGKSLLPDSVWYSIQRQTKSSKDSPKRSTLLRNFKEALIRCL